MNKTIKFLTILIFLLFSQTSVIFGSRQDSVTSKAFQLFDAGDFKNAAPLFKELLQSKPELLLLNYYYGACQTENKYYSDSILQFLLKANEEQAPAKIDYYLGLQYQAKNSWEQALKHFNKFKKNNLPESESLAVNEKIQQCFDKINPYFADYIFEEKDIVQNNPFENPLPDSLNLIDSVKTDSDISLTTIKVDSANFDSAKTNEIILEENTVESNSTSEVAPIDTLKEKSQNEIQKEKPIHPENTIETKAKPINFTINSTIRYLSVDEFKTESGKNLYLKSIQIQNKLDSVLLKIEELRKEYLTSENTNRKNIIGEEILTLENESYSLKEDLNRIKYQAALEENAYWENATEKEIEDFNATQKQIRTALKSQQEEISKTEATPNQSIDPAFLIMQDEKATMDENKAPKDEIVYKIQIGAFSRGLPSYISRLYKKLSYIRKIDNYTDENGVVVYTTGNLTNLDDALKMEKRVRQEGVDDAFVVPYFKGKRITLKQAKELSE